MQPKISVFFPVVFHFNPWIEFCVLRLNFKASVHSFICAGEPLHYICYDLRWVAFDSAVFKFYSHIFWHVFKYELACFFRLLWLLQIIVVYWRLLGFMKYLVQTTLHNGVFYAIVPISKVRLFQFLEIHAVYQTDSLHEFCIRARFGWILDVGVVVYCMSILVSVFTCLHNSL